MRTTLRLDDHLLRDAKQAAARTGRTLTALVEEALRQYLARGRQRAKRAPVALPTFKGAGVQAGVDLDDTAALLELMESQRGPD